MIDWIKAHLVEDVRDAWKWFSVQASAIAIALPVAWLALPEDFQNAIPGGVVTLMAVASLAALVGRGIKQK
jgi:hypothetical protein